MSDLLEKVARRIWRIKHPDCRDQQWEDSGWANETDEARAAIAAVLDDLFKPGRNACKSGGYVLGARYSRQDLAGLEASSLEAWQAMLAAKRKEALGDELEAPVKFDWNHDGQGDE